MPVKIKNLKYIDKWGESLEKQVLAYEEEPIRKGEIVFYGSSSFTRWKNKKYGNPILREEIVGKSGAPCCINRGFGSSCSEHQLYYYPRMVRPLEPRVLVYYFLGNNDIFGYTFEEGFELGKRVIAYAMNDFPDLRVYVQSANPRPVMDDEYIASRREINAKIREYAETLPNCFYVDVFEHQELWNNFDLYAEDKSHYNYNGYKIFGDIWREALKDELENY